MFPLAKLGELPPRTRLRKIARILQGIEVDTSAGRLPDVDYLRGLIRLFDGKLSRGLDTELPELERALDGAPPPAPAHAAAGAEAAESAAAGAAAITRAVNALRHGILRALHAEPAEWDLLSAATGALDRSGVTLLPITVYLEDIRSPFNIGSLFRTAEAFGARRIILSPRTPLPTHPRAVRTSLGTTQAVPWEVAELTAVADEPSLFALEMGGTPLADFPFPRSGVVLVGSEELGLSPEALALADGRLGRVSIPLRGAKRSLNVSVAFGILMQAWHAALDSA